MVDGVLAMAITAAQAAGGSTQDNAAAIARAFGSNVTAGNRVVMAVAKFNAAQRVFVAGDCTKTAGSSTLGAIVLEHQFVYNDTGGTSGGYIHTGIWSAAVTVGGSLTLSVAADASSYMLCGQMEFASSAGALSSSTVNQSSAASGAPSTGSVTPARYEAVVIGVLAVSGSGTTTITPDAAFTQAYEEENGGTSMTGSVIYRIITSGSATPNWNPPTTFAWCAAAASLVEPAAAANFTLPNRFARRPSVFAPGMGR